MLTYNVSGIFAECCPTNTYSAIFVFIQSGLGLTTFMRRRLRRHVFCPLYFSLRKGWLDGSNAGNYLAHVACMSINIQRDMKCIKC